MEEEETSSLDSNTFINLDINSETSAAALLLPLLLFLLLVSSGLSVQATYIVPTGANRVSNASTLAKERLSSRNVKYSSVYLVVSVRFVRLCGVRATIDNLAVEESCVEFPLAVFLL